MKPFKSIYFWGLFSLLFICSCEDKVEWTESYMANVPVYMSFSEFRQDKSISPAKEIAQPGKICLYGDYLFINEVSKGIHIINNSDPAKPQNIGFLEILGNIDMAIKDNLLFADSYSDLVCFDITNPVKPVSKSRTTDVFPYSIPPTNNYYPIDNIDYTKGIITSWEVQKVERNKESYNPPIYCYDLGYASSWDKMSESSAGTVSMTGSMARFTINGDYLYVINNYSNLMTFSIADNKATLVNSCYTNTYAETIFYYNNNLFIGSSSGLVIFSVSNPQSPVYKSFTRHILGCDPVVVNGNYAYVTIRGGNFCGQSGNLLQVIDIQNTQNPQIAASFDLTEPYGLGIDNNTLFVCDKGLKVFDATDPLQVGNKLLSSFGSMQGFDVIAHNNLLMLIGNNGLFQYDYSDIKNIRLISTISIK